MTKQRTIKKLQQELSHIATYHPELSNWEEIIAKIKTLQSANTEVNRTLSLDEVFAKNEAFEEVLEKLNEK